MQKQKDTVFPNPKIGNAVLPPSLKTSPNKEDMELGLSPDRVFSITKIKSLKDLEKFTKEADDYYGEEGLVFIKPLVMGASENTLRYYVVKTLLPDEYDEVNEIHEERFIEMVEKLKTSNKYKDRDEYEEYLKDLSANILLEETIIKGTVYPFDFESKVRNRRYIPGDAANLMTEIYKLSGWTDVIDIKKLDDYLDTVSEINESQAAAANIPTNNDYREEDNDEDYEESDEEVYQENIDEGIDISSISNMNSSKKSKSSKNIDENFN